VADAWALSKAAGYRGRGGGGGAHGRW
jgi:hypothetical protein